MEEDEEEEVEEFYIPLEFVDYQGTNLLQTFKNYSLIVRRGTFLCPPAQCSVVTGRVAVVERNARRVLIVCRARRDSKRPTRY